MPICYMTLGKPVPSWVLCVYSQTGNASALPACLNHSLRVVQPAGARPGREGSGTGSLAATPVPSCSSPDLWRQRAGLLPVCSPWPGPNPTPPRFIAPQFPYLGVSRDKGQRRFKGASWRLEIGSFTFCPSVHSPAEPLDLSLDREGHRDPERENASFRAPR